MPDIQVNTKVGVGAIGSVANNTTIGTDGLTLCVGVIAIGAANTTCAHFSCGFGGASSPLKVQQIKTETTRILTANFANNSAWGYANHAPRDWTSTAIVEACTAYFTNAAAPGSRDAETISTNAQGQIQVSSSNVVGQNTIQNTNAEVDPPAVVASSRMASQK